MLRYTTDDDIDHTVGCSCGRRRVVSDCNWSPWLDFTPASDAVEQHLLSSSLSLLLSSLSGAVDSGRNRKSGGMQRHLGHVRPPFGWKWHKISQDNCLIKNVIPDYAYNNQCDNNVEQETQLRNRVTFDMCHLYLKKWNIGNYDGW